MLHPAADTQLPTLSEVLNEFYERNHLGKDGGADKRWAYLKVGRFYIPFPNTQSRKRALLFHDVHHLATGYKSDWKGEAEISAWEISSGCADYYAAWALDLWGFFMGLVLYPKVTFLAFIRGRRTNNLYNHPLAKEELMKMRIPEIQSKLGLDGTQEKPASLNEILSFIGWSFAAVLAFCIPFVLPYALLAWWLLR